MTKLIAEIKSGKDVFKIHESLQIGETIHAGDKSIEVTSDKVLEGLKAGKLPKKIKEPETASPVEQVTEPETTEQKQEDEQV
jgi:hypothetical protein